MSRTIIQVLMSVQVSWAAFSFRCLADGPPEFRRVDINDGDTLALVWWDLHCKACHRQLHLLAARIRAGSAMHLVAMRIGVESGDRAQALGRLPPEAMACIAQPPPGGEGQLPRVFLFDDTGRLLTNWRGFRNLPLPVPQPVFPEN